MILTLILHKLASAYKTNTKTAEPGETGMVVDRYKNDTKIMYPGGYILDYISK